MFLCFSRFRKYLEVLQSYIRRNSADSVFPSNLVCITKESIETTFGHVMNKMAASITTSFDNGWKRDFIFVFS